MECILASIGWSLAMKSPMGFAPGCCYGLRTSGAAVIDESLGLPWDGFKLECTSFKLVGRARMHQLACRSRRASALLLLRSVL